MLKAAYAGLDAHTVSGKIMKCSIHDMQIIYRKSHSKRSQQMKHYRHHSN